MRCCSRQVVSSKGVGPMTDGSERLQQQQVDEHEQTRRQKFGTFSGVFRPTVMTIVGMIVFVREGGVVGNTGLLGAWLIIVLVFAIVTLTALSMSCITTNIRIGAGGRIRSSRSRSASRSPVRSPSRYFWRRRWRGRFYAPDGRVAPFGVSVPQRLWRGERSGVAGGGTWRSGAGLAAESSLVGLLPGRRRGTQKPR